MAINQYFTSDTDNVIQNVFTGQRWKQKSLQFAGEGEEKAGILIGCCIVSDVEKS